MWELHSNQSINRSIDQLIDQSTNHCVWGLPAVPKQISYTWTIPYCWATINNPMPYWWVGPRNGLPGKGNWEWGHSFGFRVSGHFRIFGMVKPEFGYIQKLRRPKPYPKQSSKAKSAGCKSISSLNPELGIANWDLVIGNWELGIGGKNTKQKTWKWQQTYEHFEITTHNKFNKTENNKKLTTTNILNTTHKEITTQHKTNIGGRTHLNKHKTTTTYNKTKDVATTNNIKYKLN